MIIVEVMRNIEPQYMGNRVVWCPSSNKKSKVITLPKDFANEGDCLHIWRLDEYSILITKLPVFEFVKRVVNTLERDSDRRG